MNQLLVPLPAVATHQGTFESLMLAPGAFAALGGASRWRSAELVLIAPAAGAIEARLAGWLAQETGAAVHLVTTPADARALAPAARRYVVATEGLTALPGEVALTLEGGWPALLPALRAQGRRGVVTRKTHETDIRIELSLDGTGQAHIHTGLGFFDHMLDQLARHGGFDLTLETQGDLHVDEHHTVEDTALALGEAFAQALADKRGLARYGFTLPMDDALAQVALDFGGRPWLVWQVTFRRERIGDVPTELFSHFFKSFADAARCNLNIQAQGENEHHLIESIFKAWARALKMAVRVEGEALPTTKGVL